MNDSSSLARTPFRAAGCTGKVRPKSFPACLVLLSALFFLPGTAGARTGEPVAASEASGAGAGVMEAEAGQVTAPVILDGKVLFRVRGVSAFPAAERANAISGRIRDFAQVKTIPVEDLHLLETDIGTNIMAREHFLMAISDADAGIEGIGRTALAKMNMTKIAETVTVYRYRRTPRYLIVNTGRALAATLVFMLTLFVIQRTFRRVRGFMETRLKERVKGLHLMSFEVVKANQLWSVLSTALRTVQLMVAALILYLFLHYVFALYPWTDPLGERLLALVVDPLARMGTATLATIPNLVFIAVLIVIIRYVIKMMRLFFVAVSEGSVTIQGFEPEWALPTYRIIRILTISFAVVVAYPYIPGSESAAFKGVSIFLGVIFSLGSSSFISNVIAGYTMVYRRAFHIGDRIQVEAFMGDVEAIRLLVTHLRTLKNEEVIIPNSLILNSNVVNYSSMARNQGLILHTTVGIGYETPWRQVEAMLLTAAQRTPGLFRDPVPFVLQKALGDFCITYELNVYTDDPKTMLLRYTLLHQNILDVFNEHGVQIMTPAYERDPEQPKVVPKDQWYAPPAKHPENSHE